jgi:coenzyme F420 hydrogenase subunit beta
MQFRCKICPDAIGENGDVAAPDGWVLREGKAVHDEAPGVNATLIRTARGAELMNNAISAGYLQAASLTLEELGQMHVDHRPRKLGWPAAQAALVLLRQPRLQIRGYRLLRTLRAAGVAHTSAIHRDD